MCGFFVVWDKSNKPELKIIHFSNTYIFKGDKYANQEFYIGNGAIVHR